MASCVTWMFAYYLFLLIYLCNGQENPYPQMWIQLIHTEEWETESNYLGVSLDWGSPGDPFLTDTPQRQAQQQGIVDGGGDVEEDVGFDDHNSDNRVDDKIQSDPLWSAGVGSCPILTLNLKHPRFVQLTKLIAPGILRIGGVLQNEVTYEVGDFKCGASRLCLTMQRWKEIIDFCTETGMRLVFGLNAMRGRLAWHSGWNSENAYAFLKHTAQMGYPVYGFEFGYSTAEEVSPEIFAMDVVTLKKYLTELWPDATRRPKLIGPGIDQDEFSWIHNFAKKAGKHMDVLTWNGWAGLGPDISLANQLTDLTITDFFRDRAHEYARLQRKFFPGTAQTWMASISPATHGGQDGVTNTFDSSLWYVTALATAALNKHSVVIRNSLIGDYNGLLNAKTLEPNPDFFIHILWQRLMGRVAQPIRYDQNAGARCFAHAKPNEITVALLNFGQDTKEIFVEEVDVEYVEQYEISAPTGGSEFLEMNGQRLTVDESGQVQPALTSEPLLTPVLSFAVPPKTVLFVKLLNPKVSRFFLGLGIGGGNLPWWLMVLLGLPMVLGVLCMLWALLATCKGRRGGVSSSSSSETSSLIGRLLRFNTWKNVAVVLVVRLIKWVRLRILPLLFVQTEKEKI